jgi:membrane associated rhomboid family serine protease
MAIPYKVDVAMVRMPIANWVLIGLTVIISVQSLVREKPRLGVTPPPNLTHQVQDLELVHETEPPFPLGLHRGPSFALWQLFTNVLVHADPLHLIGNMFFLFLFGNAINAKLGHLWYVGLYFLFGAIAGLGWLLLSTGEAVVGASGAISGMIGMFLVYYPRNDVALLRLGFIEWHFLPDAVSAGWLIVFYMVCDLWGMIAADDGVAYISHVLGTVCGIGIAWALLRLRLVDTPYGEENLFQVFGWEAVSRRPRRKKKKRLIKRPSSVRHDEPPPGADDNVRGW